MTNAFFTIYQDREVDMVRKATLFTEERRPQLENGVDLNITMDQFENSLNFFFGIVDVRTDFDSLNNPYIEFKAHQLKPDPSGSAEDKLYNDHEL